MMLVFDCPHCATQCQESALSTYLFVLVFVALVVGVVAIVKPNPEHVGVLGVVVLAIAYVPLRYLWWRFVARVKEPYVFWWERR
jgi:uncharacterized membrane-anchored protein